MPAVYGYRWCECIYIEERIFNLSAHDSILTYRSPQICWDFLNGRDCRYSTCLTALVIVKHAEGDEKGYEGQTGKLVDKIVDLNPEAVYLVLGLTYAKLKKKHGGQFQSSLKDVEESNLRDKERTEAAATGINFLGSALRLSRPKKCPHRHTYNALGNTTDFVVKEDVFELDGAGGILSAAEKERLEQQARIADNRYFKAPVRVRV